MSGEATATGAAEALSRAAPRPAPEPDFDRDVHLSLWGTRVSNSGTTPLIVQGGMGLTAVALVIVYELMNFTRVPVPVVHGVMVGIVLLALGWASVWVVRWYRRNQKIGGPGFKPDDRYRIRLIGPTDKTAAALPDGASAFEPVVIFAWLGVPPSRAGVYAWVATSAAAVLIWLGLEQLRPLGLPGIGYWKVTACLGIGGIAAALATPTYFRVVPGRIDVMRFNFFRSRRPSLQTYGLRRGRVLVDLRHRFILIEPPVTAGIEPPAQTTDWFGRRFPKPRSGTLEITLMALPEAKNLVRAVLEGAVSTAPTPPLPEDELVG